MRAAIHSAVEVLRGLRLWSSGRAADLQWFELGERRTVTDGQGRSKEVGEYALHVQCPWRIVREDAVVVGSDAAGLEQLVDADRTLLVEQLEVGAAGAIRIRFAGGYTLELFPDDATAAEQWRLFRPYRDDDHFVVTGMGLEASD